jgi:Bacterial alpha-L-rhamnosidase C-terminal domain
MALYYGGVNSTIAASISEFLPTAWTPIGAEAGELPGSIVMYVEGFEVKGHLAARETSRALDLIRLSWGWNLQNPNGTESTFVEGYKTDGSWRYRDDSYSENGAYTAHSLGWSTGPVDALVSYVVGLQPTGPGGNTWTLQPQIGDLTSAEGGFTLPTGKFSAGWNLTDGVLYLWLDVPQNTTGTLTLPINSTGSQSPKIQLDGISIASAGYIRNNELTMQLTGRAHKVQIIY